jgi:hypothetical protein
MYMPQGAVSRPRFQHGQRGLSENTVSAVSIPVGIDRLYLSQYTVSMGGIVPPHKVHSRRLKQQ